MIRMVAHVAAQDLVGVDVKATAEWLYIGVQAVVNDALDDPLVDDQGSVGADSDGDFVRKRPGVEFGALQR